MALSIPAIGELNTTADPKVKEVLTASKEHIESYRTLLFGTTMLYTDVSAATYWLGNSTNQTFASPAELTGGVGPPFLYFDDADALTTGVTQKLRLRAQVMCNATKAAIKFTFGLYPLTVAGGADQLIVTLGTVVSGSTVEINEPAASTVTSAVGSDFTIPADGAYGLAVVTSGALTNNSRVYVGSQLQTESV